MPSTAPAVGRSTTAGSERTSMAVNVMPCYVPADRASRGVREKNLERMCFGFRTGPLADGSDPLATGTD